MVYNKAEEREGNLVKNSYGYLVRPTKNGCTVTVHILLEICGQLTYGGNKHPDHASWPCISNMVTYGGIEHLDHADCKPLLYKKIILKIRQVTFLVILSFYVFRLGVRQSFLLTRIFITLRFQDMRPPTLTIKRGM
jgi:hypothetical protein